MQYTSAFINSRFKILARPLDMKRIQVMKMVCLSLNMLIVKFYQRWHNLIKIKIQIIELVAISSLYPLRGDCMAKDKNGQLWPVSKLLATHLNAVIASELQIQFNLNNETFYWRFQGTIVGIINSEPDINVNF